MTVERKVKETYRERQEPRIERKRIQQVRAANERHGHNHLDVLDTPSRWNLREDGKDNHGDLVGVSYLDVA